MINTGFCTGNTGNPLLQFLRGKANLRGRRLGYNNLRNCPAAGRNGKYGIRGKSAESKKNDGQLLHRGHLSIYLPLCKMLRLFHL